MRDLLKNLLTLGSGELVARGMHAVAFLLLARALGKEALGQFGFATAVTSYTLVLVMQGFDAIATRDVSRASGELKPYAENILGLRLLLAVVACAATGGYALLAGADRSPSRLLLILSISYVANAMTPRWSFLALEKSRPLALAGFISQSCFLVAAILIQSPSQVLWAAGAQVAGEALAALFLLWILMTRCGWLTVSFNRTFATRMIRQAWPVTLSLLLGNVMYNFDVVMLGAMGKGGEIGVYLACFRCVTVFTPLLTACQAAVFPFLARSYPNYETVRARVRWLTLAAVVALAAAGLLIGSFARELLTLLFGPDYGEGATILQVLVWVLPIQGFRMLLRQLLVTFHLQHLDTRNISYGVLTNIVLDLALIPRLGALGCAISTVSSEVVFSTLSELAVRGRVSRRPS